jgi:hypothetical protein
MQNTEQKNEAAEPLSRTKRRNQEIAVHSASLPGN